MTAFRHIAAALLAALLATPAVAQDTRIAGVWRGIMADGDSRLVAEITFPAEAGDETGSFAILTDGNRQAFPVVGLTQSADGASFAVPVSGQIDARTIYFRLAREGTALSGIARRPGSDDTRTIRLVKVR